MSKFRIHYSKRPEFFRPPARTIASLALSHAFVRAIDAADRDDVFCAMQAENWKPTKTDIAFLAHNEIRHASMSVDDVLHNCETGEWFQVLDIGWRKLS